MEHSKNIKGNNFLADKKTLLPEILLGLLLVIGLQRAFSLADFSPEIRAFQLQLIISFLLVFAVIMTRNTKIGSIRPYVLSATILSLYMPLGRIGLLSYNGLTFDPVFAKIDHAILGFELEHYLQQFSSKLLVEIFSYPYAFFIPYIHFSLLFSFVSELSSTRQARLEGFILLYAISFLGYLFLPGNGPAEYVLQESGGQLQGGVVYGLIQKAITASGGMLGAFPSLHIGASVFFCAIDFKRDPLRAILVVPIVIGIAIATLLLRFHYFIDLIVGLLLGLICALWAHFRERSYNV